MSASQSMKLSQEASISFSSWLDHKMLDPRLYDIAEIKQSFSRSLRPGLDFDNAGFYHCLSTLRKPADLEYRIGEVARNCIAHPQMHHFFEETTPNRGGSITGSVLSDGKDEERLRASISRIRRAFSIACQVDGQLEHVLDTIAREKEEKNIPVDTAAHYVKIAKKYYSPPSLDLPEHILQFPRAAAAPPPLIVHPKGPGGPPPKDHVPIERPRSAAGTMSHPHSMHGSPSPSPDRRRPADMRHSPSPGRRAKPLPATHLVSIIDAVISADRTGTLDTKRITIQNFLTQDDRPALQTLNPRVYDLLFPKKVEEPLEVPQPSGPRSFLDLLWSITGSYFAPQVVEPQEQPHHVNQVNTRSLQDLRALQRTPVQGSPPKRLAKKITNFQELIDAIFEFHRQRSLDAVRDELQEYVTDEIRLQLQEYSREAYELLFPQEVTRHGTGALEIVEPAAKSPLPSRVQTPIDPPKNHPESFTSEIQEYYTVLTSPEMRKYFDSSEDGDGEVHDVVLYEKTALLGKLQLLFHNLEIHLTNFFEDVQETATALEDAIKLTTAIISLIQKTIDTKGSKREHEQLLHDTIIHLQGCLEKRLKELRRLQSPVKSHQIVLGKSLGELPAAAAAAAAAPAAVSYRPCVSIPVAFFDSFREILIKEKRVEAAKQAEDFLTELEKVNLFVSTEAVVYKLLELLEKIRILFKHHEELMTLINRAIAATAE